MPILEQVQSDTRDAMKAGERDRVTALRLIADALQKDLKAGGEDEVAVLRRERKRRLEAAEAYRDGGSPDRAEAEEAEAREIERYLPAELSDDELARDRRRGDRGERGASGPPRWARRWGRRWRRSPAAPTASASARSSASASRATDQNLGPPPAHPR